MRFFGLHAVSLSWGWPCPHLSVSSIITNQPPSPHHHHHHQSGQGVTCGVELDEPIGTGNGTFNGFVYFRCGEKRGILVGDPG